MCDLEVEDKVYTLINIYGPNAGDQQFWVALLRAMGSMENINIVIGGDFNLVLDSDLDSRNRQESHPRSREVLGQIMNEFDLLDIWRIENPEVHLYTWNKYINKEASWLHAVLFSFICVHTTLSCACTPCCHVCEHHIVCVHTMPSCA